MPWPDGGGRGIALDRSGNVVGKEYLGAVLRNFRFPDRARKKSRVVREGVALRKESEIRWLRLRRLPCALRCPGSRSADPPKVLWGSVDEAQDSPLPDSFWLSGFAALIDEQYFGRGRSPS